MTIIERILLELSAKEVVEDGMPDFTNEKHILALNEVLIELDWSMEARGELLYRLMEKSAKEDDPWVYYTDTKGKEQKVKKSTARSYLSHKDYKNKKDKDKVAAVNAAGFTDDDKEKSGDEKEKEDKKDSDTKVKDFGRDGNYIKSDSPEWSRTDKASKRADKYKRPGSEDPEDFAKAEADKIKNLLRLKEKDPEAFKKKVKNDTTSARIGNLKAKAQHDLDAKKEEAKIKKLSKFEKTLEEDLESDDKDQVVRLVTLAWLAGGRNNTGAGKNMLGHTDIKLLHANRKRLKEMYDDAIPEEVEKGVRKARPNKVSEETVRASYDALPDSVKAALNGKGKTGKAGEELHCKGYIAKYPKGHKKEGKSYTTSDRNDPNIQKDKDGNKMVDRGKVPSTDRGRLVWRMYLEQGGVDAYTGEPLDLESMDLEHVVGFQNKDQCTAEQIKAKTCPTEEDYKNREHEANQVLCSSRANQNKKDKNMDQFFEDDIDKHMDGDKPKPEEYFEKKKEGFDKINQRTTLEEQISFGLMGNVLYKKKGGGTTDDVNHPDVEISELGTPEIADAVLGETVTEDSLAEVINLAETQMDNIKKTLTESIEKQGGTEDDVKSIKSIKTKIGAKLINAMGMTRYLQDPSGRRATKISGSDDWYKGVALSMAALPHEDRAKHREDYNECIKVAGRKEVLDAGMANEVMTAMMMKKGVLSGKNILKFSRAYGLTNKNIKKDQDDKPVNPVVILYKEKEYSVEEYADIKLKEYNKKLKLTGEDQLK